MAVCSKTSKKLCEKEDCEVCFERSFASHILSNEWSSRNEKKPRDAFIRSKDKYEFLCGKCNHYYYSTLTNITREKSKGCPYCCNQKLCIDEKCKSCFEKSFASHPCADKMWCADNEVSARHVSKKSGKKYNFKCENCKHTFTTEVYKVTNAKYNCVYCSNSKLCKDETCGWCFEYSFASHPRSNMKWWSKKNTKPPRDFFLASKEKAWFTCDVCNHDFEMILRNISGSNESWCPYCTNQILCDDEKCNCCFEKSFASHPRSNEKWWSEKNPLPPRKIFRQSNKKYYFNCTDCNHELHVCLASVSGKGNGWCAYCVHQKLCENEGCDWCFKYSFASHPKSRWWSKKNKHDPRYYAISSSEKVWFNCNECGHEIEKQISSISCGDAWCVYCANQKLCKDRECKICFEKSFASHPRSNEKWWSPKNTKSPREIFKCSSVKYKFICEKNHEFETNLANISRLDVWCSKCTKKTEERMGKWLEKEFGKGNVIYQFKPEWCISPETGLKYSYDFYISSVNVIIEIDGPHHFTQVLNWEHPARAQSKDLYKMKLAYDKKITMIRVPWTYIRSDELLIGYVEKIKKECYRSEIPRIVYLCEKDEYSHFEKYDFDKESIPKIVPKE